MRLLWDVCGIPDFRKVLSDTHARLLGQIYRLLPSLVMSAWVHKKLAADLNGMSCSDFTQPASGSDVCKTELCAS